MDALTLACRDEILRLCPMFDRYPMIDATDAAVVMAEVMREVKSRLLGTYQDALGEGCDSNGAYDSMRDLDITSILKGE